MIKKAKEFFEWTYERWSFWIILAVITFLSKEFWSMFFYENPLFLLAYVIGEILSLTAIYLIVYTLIKLLKSW